LAQNSRKRPGLNLLVIRNNADAGTLAHDNVTATLPFALVPMGFENGYYFSPRQSGILGMRQVGLRAKRIFGKPEEIRA
jgi:hypothetical protein